MSLVKNLLGDSSNNHRPKELKKDTFQKMLKYIFWGILLFLVVKSVVGDVFEPEFEYEVPQIKFDQQKPGAVAASFVKEYLTYDIQETMAEYNDYKDRIHRFSAGYMQISNLSAVSASSRVENVYIYDINKINENQYDILIKADVKYSYPEGEVKRETSYLKVPVREISGEFIVEDTPIFTPPPETVDIDYIRFNEGDELYITEANQVKGIMGNFFKTYFTGNKEEISYYMADGKPTKGFEGRFIFLDIREFNVFDLGFDNTYKAIAQVRLSDELSNKEFYQKYNLDLVKINERWYIKKLDIRGGNISESYNKDSKQE